MVRQVSDGVGTASTTLLCISRVAMGIFAKTAEIATRNFNTFIKRQGRFDTVFWEKRKFHRKVLIVGPGIY